jgi:hypothetical protein
MLSSTQQTEIITRSVANKRRRSINDPQKPNYNLSLNQSNAIKTQIDTFNKDIENFIQNWKNFDKNTLQVSSKLIFLFYFLDHNSFKFQNEIVICTNELSKQHNLAQKLIDLNKQLQNLLKTSTVSNLKKKHCKLILFNFKDSKIVQNYDLDLIFEAINGELKNLQKSTSTATPASSAQIIESFFNNLNKFLNNYKEPGQLVDQINESKAKQDEIIRKLRAENKSLKDTVNDLNKKEVCK